MKVCVLSLLAVLLGTAVAWGQVADVPRSRAEIDNGVEVLTRGPVHEAFAETVTFDPEPGIVTPKSPPAAIEEMPPEQRPEGTNVAWIPGYWAWDDERGDFLWISGIWRALPPGRQWVPGYWGFAGQGAQWTSGYWADGNTNEVEYLPEPPATVEVGPNVPATSPDHIWLPGCWLWQQNRYVWRPGYWTNGNSDWDWVPAHYVWTPRGYVFVDGYYDYTVARRGVLFAPVYFSSNSYSRQGFSYSPATVINPAVFANHLFLRPSYGHYYFGDYYGSNYTSRGFSPWFSFYSSHSGYDPFYAQQHWQHRRDDQWNRRVQADFSHRRDHEEARPARTLAAQQQQQQLRGNVRQQQDPGSVIAQQIDQFRKTKDSSFRFQPVNDNDRRQFGRLGRDVQTHRQQRQQLEAKTVEPTANPSVPRGPSARVTLPKSPFVAKRPDEFGENQRPPQIHVQPQFDPKLVPQPRRRGNSPGDTRSAPPTVKGPPNTRPTVEPKVTPKVSPTVKPRVTPKVQPKASPSKPSQPRVKPKDTPKGKAKDKPTSKSKDKPKDMPKGKNR